MEFWPIFDIFHCDHIYVPNGMKWGSTSSPHIGDVVMSLFLLWGWPFMTGDGPKMVHFGPKRAKHGRFVDAPKWSKFPEKKRLGKRLTSIFFSKFCHLRRRFGSKLKTWSRQKFYTKKMVEANLGPSTHCKPGLQAPRPKYPHFLVDWMIPKAKILRFNTLHRLLKLQSSWFCNNLMITKLDICGVLSRFTTCRKIRVFASSEPPWNLAAGSGGEL